MVCVYKIYTIFEICVVHKNITMCLLGANHAKIMILTPGPHLNLQHIFVSKKNSENLRGYDVFNSLSQKSINSHWLYFSEWYIYIYIYMMQWWTVVTFCPSFFEITITSRVLRVRAWYEYMLWVNISTFHQYIKNHDMHL